MLTFLAIIGLGLLAVGVTLLARGLTAAADSGEAVEQISAYGFTKSLDAAGHHRARRGVGETLDDIASRVGGWLGSRFSRLGSGELRARLITAGMYTTPAGRVHGYRLLLAGTGLILWIWIAGLTGASFALIVLGAIAISVVGWFLPIAYVDNRGRKRKARIERDLPDLIDLLVVTLEAGLSFPQSMKTAGEKLRGPLAQELRLTLQEQNMGLTLAEALDHFAARVETPGVRACVRSITQGETLGVSMGNIMRNLAVEMRKRRRAYAEERAQKAPVKMLFPLIFLIFPAIFIVLLLPAMLRITDAL